MADQTNSADSVTLTNEEKGMSVFLDVFRRADKNDDGSISWEEFVSYFADGVMGKEELQTLFNEIDSHNTNNIDIGELCAYFTEHLGDFQEIFGLVEELNKKLTGVLFSTSKVYKDSSRTSKFITRFLMRETLNQMGAMQRPIDAASEALDQQAREERSDIQPLEVADIVKKPVSDSGIIPGRVVRRAKRQVSNMSNNSSLASDAFAWHDDAGSGMHGTGQSVLNGQLDKLASLVDKLECKIKFENFRDEEVVTSRDDTVLLVQREFVVKEEGMTDFRSQLRAYVDVTQGFRGCYNVSVRDLRPTHSFHVYEVWCDEEHYLQNCGSEATTSLVNKTANVLEKPETVKSMVIPGSWWNQDS